LAGKTKPVLNLSNLKDAVTASHRRSVVRDGPTTTRAGSATVDVIEPISQPGEVTVLDNWDIVSGIGVTALAVAEMRARSDYLVEDRFAADFVRAARCPLAVEEPAMDYWAHYVGVRSRFYDEYLSHAVDQVVLLAAGLDARAFRLPWIDKCTVYEVDQPKVLQFKQEVLDRVGRSAPCERVVVAADLRSDWATALRRNGFDSTKPTAWLAEGLLPYLPAEAERTLFHTVHALSAPGSALAVDMSPDNDPSSMMASPVFRSLMSGLGVLMDQEWLNEPRTDSAGWLRAHGWHTTTETFTAAAERYGRPLPPDPVVGRGMLLVGHLATATTC
jgi:methyltransferase (TIGR00027 family)